MNPSPRDVLHRLPGWQGADWTELHGGFSNRTWLLEKAGARAVLKLDAQARAAPYNTRAEEARVQATAAEQGLANPVLFVDERILLCEYVDGRVWQATDVHDVENLDRLAVALRRLHALPLTGRRFEAAGAADLYRQSIDRDPQIVALCSKIIASSRLEDGVCCCHNDLVAQNIIATPSLRFLDWEYACDNDPLFDLATIVEHHGVDEQRARRLLDAYFDGGGERWQSALDRQRRLYSALLWLWLASRPGATDASLDGVAERLTTSCS